MQIHTKPKSTTRTFTQPSTETSINATDKELENKQKLTLVITFALHHEQYMF